MSEVGHNLSETMKDIQKAISDIRELKGQRKSINEDVAAIRENLQSKGIHKQAFDMALRYLDMDADKRQNFDLAYSLVREAGGLPLQGDLFAEAEKLERDIKAQKEAEKPSAKDIADRMFEQATRGKVKSDEPPSPDAAGILAVMDADAKEAEADGK